MDALRPCPDLGQSFCSPAPKLEPRAHPPADPTVGAVLAERRMLRVALIRNGIAYRDLPDVLQVVVIAAWAAIEEGRYRPDPELQPEAALRAWLRSIAWRQARDHRGRAHVRREVLTDEPMGFAQRRHGVVALDPHRRLDAREGLRSIEALPLLYRGPLGALAQGELPAAYAAETGVPLTTVWTHLRMGRALLEERLAGRGWRRP
jgi:RNA polymerase sigma-70 factor, ECF subfamily